MLALQMLQVQWIQKPVQVATRERMLVLVLVLSVAPW